MDNPALLPFVLEAISQKPELCDTYENLCEEIKYVLSTDDLKTSDGNIQKDLDDALEAGQNLGLLTLNEDLVRLPLNITKGQRKPESPRKSVNASGIAPSPRQDHHRSKH